jgi:hypothetical protein
MAYGMEPVARDPTRIKGMSERLIVSHVDSFMAAIHRSNVPTFYDAAAAARAAFGSGITQ